jgi:hypothetical protein
MQESAVVTAPFNLPPHGNLRQRSALATSRGLSR